MDANSSRFEELDEEPEPASTSVSSASSSFKDALASFPPLSQNDRSTSARREPPNEGEEAAEPDPAEEEGDVSVWWTPSELKDIIARSTALKGSGNAAFGTGEWEDALASYKEGLVELPVLSVVKRVDEGKGKGKQRSEEEGEKDEVDELAEVVKEIRLVKGEEGNSEDEKELRELRSILLANVAACMIKLERWKEAVEACDDSLEENPTYVKALSRRATANEAIGSWSSLTSALEDYNTLSTLPQVPSNLLTPIKLAQKRLPNLIIAQQTKEKDEVLGKLKDLGNTVLGKFGLSTDNFKFVQQPGGGYSMNFER